MMLDAGIDFFESLKQSGMCSSNPDIQKAVERSIPKLQSGADVIIVFQQENVFPSNFVSAVALGSQSGKLPEFLKRYSAGLKDQNQKSVQTMVKLFPIIMYWIALVMGLLSIVDFYKVYLDDILKIAP